MSTYPEIEGPAGMVDKNGFMERPLVMSESDVADWPWLRDQVEERNGDYYPARLRGDHGDPVFHLPTAARRLGLDVRSVNGRVAIDLDALRSRVENHHWLRHAEGFTWCPGCGTDLRAVGVLPPSYAQPA
jgi:hypothetical protein